MQRHTMTKIVNNSRSIVFALHQSAGSLPVCKDLSNISLKSGASYTASSFNNRGRSLSGSAALQGFRLSKSLKGNATLKGIVL